MIDWRTDCSGSDARRLTDFIACTREAIEKREKIAERADKNRGRKGGGGGEIEKFGKNGLESKSGIFGGLDCDLEEFFFLWIILVF